jgi:nicotinamide-nucleotide amidase
MVDASGAAGASSSDIAAALIARLTYDGRTVAVAESLTGGLVSAALTAIPGASAVVRGGVVAYSTALKRDLLGVDAELLNRVGAVDAEVAAQMADGVREKLGASFGVATTGVAGPDPQDGKAPGVVFVAVSTEHGRWHRELALTGDRDAIREETVRAALALLADVVGLRGE